MQPVNFQRLCELSGSLLTQILFYVFPFTSIKMPFLTGLLIVFEFFFLFDKLNYLLPVSSSKWSFPFNIKPSDLITPHTYVSTQPPVMMFPPLFQLILCQTIDQKLLHFLSCLISDSWQCVGHRVFSSWSWWEHSPINTSWPPKAGPAAGKGGGTGSLPVLGLWGTRPEDVRLVIPMAWLRQILLTRLNTCSSIAF